MKNIIQIQTILVLAFFLSIPVMLFSQEENTDKKVRIKTVKEVDGKKIVKDTTFTVSGDEDVKKVVKRFTVDSEGDGETKVTVDVDVNTDSDVEWVNDDGKKVVIIKKGSPKCDKDVRVEKKVIIINGEDGDEKVMVYPHSGHHRVMKIKSGEGEEEIIFVGPDGEKKVMKWTGEDGEEFEFDFEMGDFHEHMAELEAEMAEMDIIIMDEKGRLHDEFIELEHLAELKELEEMDHYKNMEIMMMPPKHSFHEAPHNSFTYFHGDKVEVSGKELRDAGIKSKPDRLDIDNIDINNEDGVIDLAFSLSGEGSPKVTVYNIYGDKVFSGKPDLMNNEFQIKMDLSKKQHGNYYLMIVSGNSSKTMRLKI